MSVVLSRGRLAKAPMVWSRERQNCSESSWLCRAGGRPYQALWELRILVDAGCIHLVLGEIFCSHKLRFLEVGPLDVGPLEVGSPEVGPLEGGPPEDGSPEA